MEEEIIISGPEFSGTIYWGSIAEYLIPKMKSEPKDFVAQVDLATNESVTSGEFLQQSLEVAEGLIEFGVKEQDVVALVAPVNIRSQVAAFGITFSGRILAPIDENLKAVDFQSIIKALQPNCIFCESVKAREIRDHLKAVNLNPRIVLIDSSEENEEFYNWEDVRAKVDVDSYTPRGVRNPKESITLICCSSGTTGISKGVAISHYAVLNSLISLQNSYQTTKKENLMMSSSLYWISGYLMSLNSGYLGLTRYAPRSIDPEDLLEAIQKSKTFFILVSPTKLLSMTDHRNFKNYDVSSVKIIVSGGGTLGDYIYDKVKKNWSGATIINAYGLTETIGGITSFYQRDPKAIGKLLPGVSVKVVDPSTGKSLGPRQIGECRLKSDRIMNCYYNNEEETKITFDENGWLRTGDLVYYDEEEVFYFVGRIKESISYQNYQVLPSELEAFITCLPGVKDVAVVPIPDEIDEAHVRALVVKDLNSEINAEDVIRAVEENFVYYKHLTAGVQFVDALPRTGVGKLKRVEAQKLIDLTANNNSRCKCKDCNIRYN